MTILSNQERCRDDGDLLKEATLTKPTPTDSFVPTRVGHLPPPRSDDWSWQLRGRCRGYPSEVFFPETDDRQRRRGREAAAKQICDGCPVVALCREHALNTPEVHGIWGAMTARERARLRSTMLDA